jgi:hypothetical protein
MMVFLPSLFFISQIVKALSENRVSGGTRLSMLNNILMRVDVSAATQGG